MYLWKEGRKNTFCLVLWHWAYGEGPTNRIAHTMTFVIPVVEQSEMRNSSMRDQSDDPLLHLAPHVFMRI